MIRYFCDICDDVIPEKTTHYSLMERIKNYGASLDQQIVAQTNIEIIYKAGIAHVCDKHLRTLVEMDTKQAVTCTIIDYEGTTGSWRKEDDTANMGGESHG